MYNNSVILFYSICVRCASNLCGGGGLTKSRSAGIMQAKITRLQGIYKHLIDYKIWHL